MKVANKMYSVYVSNAVVELRSEQTDYYSIGRFICSHSDYKNALDFATNLAKYKRLPMHNHVAGGN